MSVVFPKIHYKFENCNEDQIIAARALMNPWNEEYDKNNEVPFGLPKLFESWDHVGPFEYWCGCDEFEVGCFRKPAIRAMKICKRLFPDMKITFQVKLENEYEEWDGECYTTDNIDNVEDPLF